MGIDVLAEMAWEKFSVGFSEAGTLAAGARPHTQAIEI